MIILWSMYKCTQLLPPIPGPGGPSLAGSKLFCLQAWPTPQTGTGAGPWTGWVPMGPPRRTTGPTPSAGVTSSPSGQAPAQVSLIPQLIPQLTFYSDSILFYFQYLCYLYSTLFLKSIGTVLSTAPLLYITLLRVLFCVLSRKGTMNVM